MFFRKINSGICHEVSLTESWVFIIFFLQTMSAYALGDEASMIFTFWLRTFAPAEVKSSEELLPIVLKYHWTSHDKMVYIQRQILTSLDFMTPDIERHQVALIFSYWIRTVAAGVSSDDMVTIVYKYYWTSWDKIESMKSQLFVMTTAKVLSRLEAEGTWNIDKEVRDHFSAKSFYESALKEVCASYDSLLV